MVDHGEQERVSFNIAQVHASNLAKGLNRVSTLYLQGDLDGWFWALTDIHERVYYNMHPEIQVKLDFLCKNCEKYSKFWKLWKNLDQTGEKVSKDILIGKVQFAKNIKIYSRALTTELKEQGWYPTKSQIESVTFE